MYLNGGHAREERVEAREHEHVGEVPVDRRGALLEVRRLLLAVLEVSMSIVLVTHA